MKNFDTIIFDRLFELFINLRAELLQWVVVIIMIRVIINLIMFKSASDMLTIIKDVLLGMILLCFFVEIIKFSQMIPNMLHDKLSSPDQVEVKFEDGSTLFWTIASYITVGAYWISKIIYTIFIAILIGLGGFFIVAGTMLAQSYLLNIFFICLIGASCMPIIWFVINESMKSFALGRDSTLSHFFILLAGEVVKIVIPVGGAVGLFKNPIVQNMKDSASIPAKAMNKGFNQAFHQTATHLHPNSKTRQFLKTAFGKPKYAGPDSFPSLNKHYEHKNNKANFNNWLHGREPNAFGDNKENIVKDSSKNDPSSQKNNIEMSSSSNIQSNLKTNIPQNNSINNKLESGNMNNANNNVNSKVISEPTEKLAVNKSDNAIKNGVPNNQIKNIPETKAIKNNLVESGKNLDSNINSKSKEVTTPVQDMKSHVEFDKPRTNIDISFGENAQNKPDNQEVQP